MEYDSRNSGKDAQDSLHDIRPSTYFVLGGAIVTK